MTIIVVLGIEAAICLLRQSTDKRPVMVKYHCPSSLIRRRNFTTPLNNQVLGEMVSDCQPTCLSCRIWESVSELYQVKTCGLGVGNLLTCLAQ